MDNETGNYFPGWCTYEYTLKDAPEIELICGGINSKTPDAVGIWRQGNLMHFGFDLSPDQMNDTGDAMLINTIVYIARFTDDRPNVQAPSPFAGAYSRARESTLGLLRDDRPLSWFEGAIDPTVLDTITDRTRDGYRRWFAEHRRYLRPNDGGMLTLDRDAMMLEVAYDSPALFDVAIAALGKPDTSDAATRLLARFAPTGPVGRDAAAWRQWHKANKPYLFFSEWGQYRWYVDRLAQQRGIPTAQLRGVARASR